MRKARGPRRQQGGSQGEAPYSSQFFSPKSVKNPKGSAGGNSHPLVTLLSQFWFPDSGLTLFSFTSSDLNTALVFPREALSFTLSQAFCLFLAPLPITMYCSGSYDTSGMVTHFSRKSSQSGCICEPSYHKRLPQTAQGRHTLLPAEGCQGLWQPGIRLAAAASPPCHGAPALAASPVLWWASLSW